MGRGDICWGAGGEGGWGLPMTTPIPSPVTIPGKPRPWQNWMTEVGTPPNPATSLTVWVLVGEWEVGGYEPPAPPSVPPCALLLVGLVPPGWGVSP